MHLGGVDLQGRQTKQHQRQTHQKITEVSVSLGVDKRYSKHDRRINDQTQVKRTAAEYHDPRRERSTDVGTHDHRDRLSKG